MKRSVKVLFISIFMMIILTSSAFAQGLLSVGIRGSAVTALQNDLKSLNYQVGASDGIFGQQTKQAVVAFQRDNNLSADGVVGPQTSSVISAKLKNTSNTTTPTTTTQVNNSISTSSSGPLRQGMYGNAIVNLQKNLKSLNYSIGAIDGAFGPNTLQAVKAFQRDNGLSIDGIVGAKTIESIKNKLNQKTSTPVDRGETTTTQTKVQAVIATAKSFIGVPYATAGASPSGFDCSGYTQYVMSKNGISIPRTAATQFTKGTSINRSNLQAGDFVFFETYKAGASHVGFYIGNNNFIHASSSGVMISSLSNSYWSPRYVGARRIIQ